MHAASACVECQLINPLMEDTRSRFGSHKCAQPMHAFVHAGRVLPSFFFLLWRDVVVVCVLFYGIAGDVLKGPQFVVTLRRRLL